MAWSFNVFTGNLDQTGSGAVVFEGEVATFADLPQTVGDPAVGSSYLVRESTGVWLVNRKQAGIWIRSNNTGVRDTDWTYGGDYPVNSVNGKTGNVSLGKSDVGLGNVSNTAQVTSVSGTAPIVSSGGTTPAISLQNSPTLTGDVRVNGASAGVTGSLQVGSTTGSFSRDAELNGGGLVLRNIGASGVVTIARAPHGTFNYTLTPPAASGTIALTSDIPSTFAASAITSGVLDNARINFAAPSAIGSTTPSTGAFTTLSASGAITAAAGTAGTPTTPATALGVQWSGLGGTDIAAVYGTYSGAGKVGIGVGTSGILTEVASFALGGIALNRATTVSNGTLTASAPVLDLSQTWNNAAVTFTGLRFNVTNTASATASPLIDLQVGGVSRMRMTRGGTLHLSEHSNSGLYSPAPVWTGSTAGLLAATNLAVGSSLDTILERGGAGILEQRNLANAQTFRLYNTFTDASNYERGFMRWNASVLEIGTEALGTGSSRDVAFFRGGARQLTLLGNGAVRLESTGQLAWSSRGAIFMSADGVMWLSNNAGTDFGRLAFGGTTSSFPALKRSSTTLQVRLADDSAFAPLDSGTLNVTGSMTSTGACRANSYASVGNNAGISFADGFTSITGINTAGVLTVSAFNSADVLIRLGGTSSSWPALNSSGSTLRIRLADNSGFAPLSCGALTLNGNLDASTKDIVTDTTTGTKIGTGTTQKLGFFNATPVTQRAAIADATDAATTQARLNDLLAAMRSLGLIAT